MADNGGVAVFLRQADRAKRLGERTDLVHLDEDRVGHALVDAALQEFGVGDEQVVADKLHAVTDLVGERLPAGPVVLVAAVLDADDRVFAGEFVVEGHQLGGGQLVAAAFLENIPLLLRVIKLAAGHVEREEDLFPGLVAGVARGGEDRLERLLHAAERRRETALVANGGGEALLFQHSLESVKNLGDRAQAFAERVEALRHDHEFLKIDRGIRVGAAVDDVRHRHRQYVGLRAAEVAKERLAGRVCRRLGAGQRNGEDGIGAEGGLVVGAVEIEHRLVDRRLVGGIDAGERREHLVVDVGDGLPDALAEVAALVAVAQLERLVFAGARAAGHGGAPKRAVLEGDIGLDGGVATRVEDFAGQDAFDFCHGVNPPERGWPDMID